MAVTSEHSMHWREKFKIGYKNEICEVFELASQNYLEAKYIDGVREGPIHNAIFNVILTCGEFVGEGKGPTKNAAKMQAAQQILPDLRLLPRDENPNKKRKKKRGGALNKRPLSKPEKPVVEELNELVTNLRGKPEEYTLVDVNKDSYPCIFSMKLVVAGMTVVARGHNKKEAKRNAAAKMLNVFGYSCSVPEPELVSVEEVAKELPIQQEVEIQPPVEKMGPVLPILIATEEIEGKNEEFQLCATSQQPDNQVLSVIVEDGADISKNVKPGEDVSSHQEVVDVCSSSETTTEESQICNIVENHRELGQMNVFEDEQLLQGPEIEVEAHEMSSYNVDKAAPIDQDFLPELLLEPALTEEGDDLIINQEATLEENNPQANINYLPDDILSMLAHMGVITENNGTLAWAETTTNEERETSPIEDQTRDKSVSVVSDKHKDQGELSPIDPPCPEETSACTVEEITEANNKSSETFYEEKSENLILNEPEKEVSLIDPPRPEEISIRKQEESLESSEENCENLIPDRPEDLDKPCQEEDNISIIQESMKSANKTTTLTIILTLRSNPNPETCIKSFEETCDNLTSDRPEGLDPIDKPGQEEDNSSIVEESLESANVAPETEACKSTARKTAHYLTRSFVRKVFEMDGEEDDVRARALRTIELQRKVEKSLNIDYNQSQFKPEQLEKIGKKVAKRLKVKNGSIEELVPDVLEQFNTELRTLQNRPKSGLARFFSRVRKAFTF